MDSRQLPIPTLTCAKIKQIGELYFKTYPKAKEGSFRARFHCATKNLFNPHTNYLTAETLRNYSQNVSAWDQWIFLIGIYKNLDHGFLTKKIEYLFESDFSYKKLIKGVVAGGNYIAYTTPMIAIQMQEIVVNNLNINSRKLDNSDSKKEVEMQTFSK